MGGVAQMTGIFETTPNTCDVPTNRGASTTDRSTWSNKRDTSNNPNGCSNERDATTEEILHLITAAASAVYPNIGGFCEWCPDAACDDIGLVDDAGVEDCNNKCGGDGDECEDDPAFAFRNRKRLNCGWVGRHRKKNRLCKRKWKGEKIAVHCPETCDECD